jgi:dihydroxyacetone kinase phosphotransfer subunit
MTSSVAILIVSHSPDVARGVADMVRQMAGKDVPVAWTGGDPAGGLGTDVAKIRAALDSIWRPEGVAIFVDLGGAETNSEMVVEMLPPERRERVVICNAPLVEGAIMAAAEAASGGDLAAVRKAAEEFFSP